MRYGTVVQYFPEKGFGFIRPDHGADIFFHVTALGACQAPQPIEMGQPVKYELVPGTEPKTKRRSRRDEEDGPPAPPVGPQAQFVELIDKMPGGILVDNIPTGRPQHPKSKKRKPTWRTPKQA